MVSPSSTSDHFSPSVSTGNDIEDRLRGGPPGSSPHYLAKLAFGLGQNGTPVFVLVTGEAEKPRGRPKEAAPRTCRVLPRLAYRPGGKSSPSSAWQLPQPSE